MPKISAVATAVPCHRVGQIEAREFARRHFSSRMLDIDRLLPVFANSGIHTRYFSMPVEWMTQPHSPEEKSKAYIENATVLSAQAARNLMEKNNIETDRIDYIIYVNTTGLATPSIDARLINVLGLRPTIRRTSVWGLGCAGGAAGLSMAYHYALGHPTETILLIATELCGLTFLPGDFSRSNLVAMALFGEGSAAVLITGDQVEADGLEIVGTGSRFIPDSLDVMGWNVVSAGLQVVFAKRIPDIVREHAAKDIKDFLGNYGLTLSDIAAFLFHPGGAKVLAAYEEALGLKNGDLLMAKEILRDYGNMSSVTVLHLLERFIDQSGNGTSGYGLISALGPGFCSESILVRL